MGRRSHHRSCARSRGAVHESAISKRNGEPDGHGPHNSRCPRCAEEPGHGRKFFTSMKTLVIGLDSAAPEILFKDERLTNFRRLMEGGCYGELETIIPPITVPAWMCM